MPRDPFRPVDLTVEYVEFAAGSRETLTAIAVAWRRACTGVKTLATMPTLELAREMAEFAGRAEGVSRSEDLKGPRVSIPERIAQHVILAPEVTRIPGGAGFRRVIPGPL